MSQLRNKKEIRKYFVLNRSKNGKYQNMRNAIKAVISGRFRVLNVYITR